MITETTTLDEDLKYLVENSHAVSINVNECRTCHRNAAQEIQMMGEMGNDWMLKDTEEEVIKKIVSMDRLIEVRCYPNTAISFFNAYHYDVARAVKETAQLLYTCRNPSVAVGGGK